MVPSLRKNWFAVAVGISWPAVLAQRPLAARRDLAVRQFPKSLLSRLAQKRTDAQRWQLAAGGDLRVAVPLLSASAGLFIYLVHAGLFERTLCDTATTLPWQCWCTFFLMESAVAPLRACLLLL